MEGVLAKRRFRYAKKDGYVISTDVAYKNVISNGLGCKNVIYKAARFGC